MSQYTNPAVQMLASKMETDDPDTSDGNNDSVYLYFGGILQQNPPPEAEQGAHLLPPEILNPPPEGHLNLLWQAHNRSVSRNARPQLSDDQLLRAVHHRLFTASPSTQHPPAENLRPAHEQHDLAPFYNGAVWLNEDILDTVFEVDFSNFVRPIPTPPQPGIYYIRVENRNGWDRDTLTWVMKREDSLYGSHGALRWRVSEYYDHQNLQKRSYLKKPCGKLETWGLVQYITGVGANHGPSLYERVGGVEEGLKAVERAVDEGYNDLKGDLDDIMGMLGVPHEASGSGSED